MCYPDLASIHLERKVQFPDTDTLATERCGKPILMIGKRGKLKNA